MWKLSTDINCKLCLTGYTEMIFQLQFVLKMLFISNLNKKIFEGDIGIKFDKFMYVLIQIASMRHFTHLSDVLTLEILRTLEHFGSVSHCL